jgi:hypothetical protein
MLRGPTVGTSLRLLVALSVVHVAVPTTPFLARAKAATPKTSEDLPPGVIEMREAILEAVRSGRLDDLKLALDLNELKPELGPALVADPIAFWRGLSVDASGYTGKCRGVAGGPVCGDAIGQRR